MNRNFLLTASFVCFLFLSQSIWSQKVVLPIPANHLVSATGAKGEAARGGGATGCLHTSGAFDIQKDSSILGYYNTTALKDGNLLVVCTEIFFIPSPYAGTLWTRNKLLLFKCTPAGVIIWKRSFGFATTATDPSPYYNLYRIKELQDGTILIAGETGNAQNSYSDMLLMHMDNTGNILWTKTYASQLWTGFQNASMAFEIRDIKDDVNGRDIYITATGGVAGRNITRISGVNGEVVWSNYYKPAGNVSRDRAYGIDIDGEVLVSFGAFEDNAQKTSVIGIYRLNKQTGDTLQTKYLAVTDTAGTRVGFLRNEVVTKMNDGNYMIMGCQNGYYLPRQNNYHAGIIIIDSSLKLVNAWSIRSPDLAYAGVSTAVFPDGTGVLAVQAEIQGGYSTDSYFIQFKGSTLLKARKRRNELRVGGERFVQLPDGSNTYLGFAQVPNTLFPGWLRFGNIDASDVESSCLGTDYHGAFTQPYKMAEAYWKLSTIVKDDMKESLPRTFSTITATAITSTPLCSQTSECNLLKLKASADTVCYGTPLVLTVTKNAACGAWPVFNYDSAAVQSFARLTDSTYRMVFKGNWSGGIRVGIAGCTVLEDSVRIVAGGLPQRLMLGEDTLICAGSELMLRAGSGFSSYQWQDGSADSLFTVKKEGIYTVVVKDGCGKSYTDDITVGIQSVVPPYLGPDKQICKGDTVNLIAPGGFTRYSWIPDYRISSRSTGEVKANPLIDTLYMLTAETPEGCLAYDTIGIHVNEPATIHLGRDTSLCNGDSVMLHAGRGFVTYAWSSGADGESLAVYAPGVYSVVATDINGCKASDTMQLLQLSALPVVELGADTVLCKGSFITLDAGRHSAWYWNTGERTPSITVSAPGEYRVTVADEHGCRGVDSITFTRFINIPAGFLPADTAICSYNTLLLYTHDEFASYLWNTGSSSTGISVSDAGVYWLQVIDKYGCTGRDSILVNIKNCMEGAYIPTAFTPNGDGKNDVFRPLIYGNIEQYELSVYNRWGQLIFTSSKPGQGWDGTVKGQKQDMNTYLWVCRYKLKGGNAAVEKGTVLLMR